MIINFNLSGSDYTTYITTWGTDPLAQIQAMIANGTINSHTTIDIAFANFDWTASDVIPGLLANVSAEMPQIVSAIRAAGGKVNLSVGGATYPMEGTNAYNNPSEAADYISQTLKDCGFDGVDFDIEDNDTSDAFNNTAAQFINDVRAGDPNAFISLTLPGQAWYRQNLVTQVINSINTFQPMEYCIWVNSTGTYSDQIESDMRTYNQQWGVPYSKMTLGLMPGYDNPPSQGNNLTVADAAGIGGEPPYAYTQAIEAALNPSTPSTNVQSLGQKGGGKTFTPINQDLPPNEPQKYRPKDWLRKQGNHLAE